MTRSYVGHFCCVLAATSSHGSLISSAMESLDWSDDDDEKKIGALADDISPGTSKPGVAELERDLLAANHQISQLKSIAQQLVGASATSSSKVPMLSELVDGKQERDDDSHYFESYGYQGRLNNYPLLLTRCVPCPLHLEIHGIMLQDSVRTSSYAKFLLSNPQLLRDKLVMDVGCGE
jgi:type I protein arginine methyltransferase